MRVAYAAVAPWPAGFDAAPVEAASQPRTRAVPSSGFSGFENASGEKFPPSSRQAPAAAGFGGAASAVAPVQTPPLKSTVSHAGFGDAGVVRSSEPPAKASRQIGFSDVEITFKPRPDYTEEARRRRIEGEVVLEVTFGSSGKVRVLRIVKGLGAGLDENAIQAASRIVFKPASEGGRPVDCTAIARITFQLAY